MVRNIYICFIKTWPSHNIHLGLIFSSFTEFQHVVESDKMSAIACRDIINLNSHVDSEMTCIVCQRTFSSSKRKQIHLIRKHSVRSDENIGREYKCHQCDKVYTTRSNLIIHERIHSGSYERMLHTIDYLIKILKNLIHEIKKWA